jgi:hypothetical protein
MEPGHQHAKRVNLCFLFLFKQKPAWLVERSVAAVGGKLLMEEDVNTSKH